MLQGELIDSLYESMYKKALQPKFGFSRFAVPWGRKDSPERGYKQTDFSKTMREFASECGVLTMNGQFYVFNGRVYEAVPVFVVEQAYDRLIESLGIAEVLHNKTLRQAVFLNNILAYNPLMVRNDLIAFSNKVVDLTHGGTPRQFSFSPKFHVIDYHPYPFIEDAKSPIWDSFIHEVLPNKRDRDILQMFLGLGLIQTGDAFGHGGPRGTVELCLLLLGSGANGKSVLFNVICALFGKQHISSLDYDMLTADGDEGLRNRYTIRNAVFNWSSDSNPKKFGKKNTSIFKQIVSGEEVQVRGIRENVKPCSELPYLIFSLNEPPTGYEATNGFLRRLQYVNFDVTIPRYKQDPNLAFRIIQSDLPGVFNWVLRGAMELKRRKFQFPESETTMKQIVRSLFGTNTVKSWMLAFGLRQGGNTAGEIHTAVPGFVMYETFRQFCIDNNMNDEEIPSERSFYYSLVREGFVRKRRSDGMYYICYGCDADAMREHIYIDSITEPEDYSTDDSLIISD